MEPTPNPLESPDQPKIGVYICRCGGNISDYLDTEKLADTVRGIDNVLVRLEAFAGLSFLGGLAAHEFSNASLRSEAGFARPVHLQSRHHLTDMRC